MAVEPEFYGANVHTPYPFTGPYDELTSQIVDAEISVPASSSGAVLVTRYRSAPDLAPLLELSDSTGVIMSGATVVVSSFGDYDIWQAAAGQVRATLVVAKGAAPVDYSGPGYELIPHVVSNQNSPVVESVETASVQVAGPGATLTLQAGSNISFVVAAQEGTSTVTVVAEQRSTGPCVPPELRPAAYISRINSQAPDANGDLKIRGSGIWVVDPATNGLEMLNIGKECCACEDYAELFKRLLVTNARLAVTRDWIINNQYRYRVLLEYTKFLLRHQIVGGIDPNDTSTTMAC